MRKQSRPDKPEFAPLPPVRRSDHSTEQVTKTAQGGSTPQLPDSVISYIEKAAATLIRVGDLCDALYPDFFIKHTELMSIAGFKRELTMTTTSSCLSIFFSGKAYINRLEAQALKVLTGDPYEISIMMDTYNSDPSPRRTADDVPSSPTLAALADLDQKQNTTLFHTTLDTLNALFEQVAKIDGPITALENATIAKVMSTFGESPDIYGSWFVSACSIEANQKESGLAAHVPESSRITKLTTFSNTSSVNTNKKLLVETSKDDPTTAIQIIGSNLPAKEEGASARIEEGSVDAKGDQSAHQSQLELIDWRWSKSSDSFATVEGLVKNISDQPLKDVEAVAIFYAADHGFITSATGLIEYTPLLPGQESPFKVLVSGNPGMHSATIDFKHAGGGSIPFRNKPALGARTCVWIKTASC